MQVEVELPQILLAAFSLLSPMLIAIFTQVGWSAKTKQVVTMGVAVVAGVVYTVLNGTWTNMTDIGTAVTTVYMLSQAGYHLMMKDLAKEIESKTTILKPQPEEVIGDDQSIPVHGDVPADRADTEPVG